MSIAVTRRPAKAESDDTSVWARTSAGTSRSKAAVNHLIEEPSVETPPLYLSFTLGMGNVAVTTSDDPCVFVVAPNSQK